ncbi:ANTAR domain-containing response regulator [Streptomyces californicus]|uniref:ANTAR domain-containing response regulator n=1 Tax=Streptomyces californicus TaxID=67351 RepID=UPI003401AAB0
MDWRKFAEQIGVMAHDLLEQPSVDATLGRITGSAAELVAGCDAAGILVLSGQESASLAPTEPWVAELDQLQRKLGQGPCFDAARRSTGERVFRIADFTEDEPRWPDFVAEARKAGVGSMMGFLLYTDEKDFGALNFYSHRPGTFTEESERAGVVLASHAAVALSAARTHAQMEQAVATRHQIGQAMGILMARHHIPENQAFNTLRRYSQNHNAKLRDVALLVCDQGALPKT